MKRSSDVARSITTLYSSIGDFSYHPSVLDSIALQAAVLFATAIGTTFAALFLLRGGDVLRGLARRGRGLMLACLLAPAIGAVVVVFAARDHVLCPAGFADPAAATTRTSSGKGGMKIVCRSPDGESTSGSVFAGVAAWLGAWALLLGASTSLLRVAGVQAPVPPPPLPAPPPPGGPRDRIERRRARKARDRADRA
jgi:hypothetical protein